MSLTFFQMEDWEKRSIFEDWKKGTIPMKKFLALALALVMSLSLAACGSKSEPEKTPEDTEEDQTVQELTADQIADSMTSEDGTYEVAFITDLGALKDQSFNEGIWNGVKLYAYNHDLSYRYYQPANGNDATDEDRYNAMAAAAEAGAKVVLCAGYLQENALRRAATDYPDTKFVFIDGSVINEEGSDTPLANVAGIAFQEEQSGYLAGYAVVKDGFTKLGFAGGGGGTNPACCRYGYGFVQGANAAAAELGVQVEMNYTWQYGEDYAASPELQELCNGWYQNGTQVIFACGGAMLQSVAEAAAANGGYVVGVDTDQSGSSDTVITSAMKDVGLAAEYAIGKVYDNDWSDIGGLTTTLGAADDVVGLPTEEGSWRLKTYTVEEYQTKLESVRTGETQVDADYSHLQQAYSNLTLNIL